MVGVVSVAQDVESDRLNWFGINRPPCLGTPLKTTAKAEKKQGAAKKQEPREMMPNKIRTRQSQRALCACTETCVAGVVCI